MDKNVDIKKMQEVFDEDIANVISENMELIEENMKYLISLGFDDVPNLFERCPYTFMKFSSNFKNDIDDLIKKLGSNYVDEIQNDVSYLENL